VGVHFPKSMMHIEFSSPISTKFINSPPLFRINVKPSVFVQFSFFWLIFVYCFPLFWPWCRRCIMHYTYWTPCWPQTGLDKYTTWHEKLLMQHIRMRVHNVYTVIYAYSIYSDWPSILVPGLDLCVAEVELGSQFHAVLDAEVLLSLEALFQCVQLVIGEGRPRLPCLLRLRRLTLMQVLMKMATGRQRWTLFRIYIMYTYKTVL